MTADLRESNLIRLNSALQKYPWGKKGSSSLVAQLAPQSVGPDSKLDEDQTYAEVGTLLD